MLDPQERMRQGRLSPKYNGLPPMTDLSHLSQETPINLEELRERLRKMSDSELRRFGRAALDVCKPHRGVPPREVFVTQSEEARAEWKHKS